MIVISNPESISEEIKFIKNLFEQGMQKFHLRKPKFTIAETKSVLEQIGFEHHSKIVLHQHYELCKYFNITQIHLSESQRKTQDYSAVDKLSLSTSVHNMEDFNALDTIFKYAFISPIFTSISKPNYSVDTTWEEELKKRTNFNTKIVALGGIDYTKIQDIKSMGFDDYALLGSIWMHKNGLENFKKCQQTAYEL